MNSYPWISVPQIVGRAMRRSGLKDTSLIPDMNEWVAEVLQILQVSDILQSTFEENMKVSFHKVKKPCGCRELLGVSYCGTRLPVSMTVRDPRTTREVSTKASALDAVFVSGITVEETPSGNKTFLGHIEALESLPWNECAWYKDDGSHLLTSFEDGYITMYYNRIPLDQKGFIQVPDEGNLKESITWFLLARLKGRGYYATSGYSEAEMDAKHEIYAGRAKEAITFPSLDQAQASMEELTQLLPDVDYYTSFYM